MSWAAARRSSATKAVPSKPGCTRSSSSTTSALSFRLKDYPLDIEAQDIAVSIAVRPEATILTYSHAAFTVRQILLAPIDEPGIVMLLDVDGVLPMTMIGAFRPRLRLMWPAGLMTPNVEWDEKAHVYFLTEESKRFAGVLGSPRARDLAVMPYQEEPRDVLIRFAIEFPMSAARSGYLPIVMAGSVTGRDEAKAVYDRLLASARALYAKNVDHYRALAGADDVDHDARLPARRSRSPGRRSASTKASPPTPCSAPAFWPASALRGTASGPASAGSSVATPSGRPSPSTPTATSARPAPPSTS